MSKVAQKGPRKDMHGNGHHCSLAGSLQLNFQPLREQSLTLSCFGLSRTVIEGGGGKQSTATTNTLVSFLQTERKLCKQRALVAEFQLLVWLQSSAVLHCSSTCAGWLKTKKCILSCLQSCSGIRQQLINREIWYVFCAVMVRKEDGNQAGLNGS